MIKDYLDYENIPKNWKIAYLSEISEITSGNSAPKDSLFSKNGIPFVRVSDLSNNNKNKFITNTRDKIPLEIGKKIRLKLFPKGSIILTKSGASIFLNHRAILAQDSFVVGHNAVIQTKSVDRDFLFYYLANFDMKKISQTTSLPSVNLSAIGKIIVLIPTISEQQKISSILSNVDGSLQNLQLIQDQTTFLKNGLMKKLISNNKTKFIELGQVIELIIDHRGITPKKLGGDWTTDGIQVISAFNIKNFQLAREDEPRFISPTLAKKWMPEKLKKNDVLITSEGATLGQIAFLFEEKDYCIGQRLFAVRTKQKILNGKFLYYYLISDEGQQQIFQRATGSTAKGIRQQEIIKIRIPILPLENQIKISSILSNIDLQIQQIINKKFNLQLQKKWLMQNLLTGKILVKIS